MWSMFFQLILVPLVASSLYCHRQSQSWTLLHSSGSVLCTCTVSGLRLLSPKRSPVYTAVGSNAELLGVCVPNIPPTHCHLHAAVNIQQHDMIFINRVSLDSSYCVTRCFLFGRDGASVTFMGQQYVFLEFWTKWKIWGFQAIRPRVGHLVWSF